MHPAVSQGRSERDIRPVVQPLPLRPLTATEPLPGVWLQPSSKRRHGDLAGGAVGWPGSRLLVALDRDDVRLVPLFCRATPHECVPFFRNPVSSTTSTPSGVPRCSTT